MSSRILLTGCGGQLGIALTKAYSKDDSVELILTDTAELDITDNKKVLSFIRETKPDTIINCAAFTAVDACESDFDLAFKVNAIGPKNLAIAAGETGAKFVHVSTDYVFDGKGSSPYREYDAVCPNSAYGRTKLCGEQYVKDFCDRFFILRTAWLYGEGKNFVKTMLKLSENHDEVSVVDDQIGTPTSAVELAKAVVFLEKTENYGLYHATCEGVCSWADFAARIFKLAGKKTKVNYISTADYKKMNPLTADRPAYSVLDNYMLHTDLDYYFADWEKAIEEYLTQF